MLTGNVLVWLIPKARRKLNAEAQPHPGTTFREAQSQLLKVAIFLVPLSVSITMLGAMLPW